MARFAAADLRADPGQTGGHNEFSAPLARGDPARSATSSAHHADHRRGGRNRSRPQPGRMWAQRKVLRHRARRGWSFGKGRPAAASRSPGVLAKQRYAKFLGRRRSAHLRPVSRSPSPAGLAAVKAVIDDNLCATAEEHGALRQRAAAGRCSGAHPLIGEVRSPRSDGVDRALSGIGSPRSRPTVEAHQVFREGARSVGVILGESRLRPNLGQPDQDQAARWTSAASCFARGAGTCSTRSWAKGRVRARGWQRHDYSPANAAPLGSDSDDSRRTGLRPGSSAARMSPFTALSRWPSSMVSINTGHRDPVRRIRFDAVGGRRRLPLAPGCCCWSSPWSPSNAHPGRPDPDHRLRLPVVQPGWSARTFRAGFTGWDRAHLLSWPAPPGTAGRDRPPSSPREIWADPTPRQVQLLSIGCTVIVAILNIIGVRLATRINKRRRVDRAHRHGHPRPSC